MVHLVGLYGFLVNDCDVFRNPLVNRHVVIVEVINKGYITLNKCGIIYGVCG
jgi:hypothetical protein